MSKNFRELEKGESIFKELAMEAGADSSKDSIGWIRGTDDGPGAFTADTDTDLNVIAARAFKGADGVAGTADDIHVVKLSGAGIGGNAIAKFGVGDDAKAAAEEFAAQLDNLRELGILDDVLMEGSGAAGLGDGSGWNELAAAVAATDDVADAFEFSGEQVSSVNENDPRYDGETSDVALWAARLDDDNPNNDVDRYAVKFGGNGVGGNATAVFGTEAEAETFKALADIELLTTDGTNDLFLI